VIKLSSELDKFLNKINNHENFALLRLADGERSIMTRQKIKGVDGWETSGAQTALGLALENTLKLNEANVYYGISCPCCDRAAYYWYSSRIENKNITFSNLFVNKNYRRFIAEFEKITRDAVVIANYKGKDNKIGNLNILKYYSVGDSCVDFYENSAQQLIDEIIKDFGDKKNLLYVVSADPLSEPIIYKLYKNNPDNCYIDFGSSIDRYIHKRDTRPYTDPNSMYGSRDCWMFEPKQTNFDVSVVLSAYKKPDVLRQQLEAIENQTLKPKEILLFQDGIAQDYKINFNSEILARFDKYFIADENKGVWERFNFALNNASSKYICILDDDTVPGRRWLENCHFNIMQQDGIYGTVGILINNFKKCNYPYGVLTDYYRFGWPFPMDKTIEVDFVGHAWFLKREYLNYMFEDTEQYQEFKYAAEDMCLSFKCAQHGIKTFVPPHPSNDEELWGSLFGMKYGTASTAISLNPANVDKMLEAFNLFKANGWENYAQSNKARTDTLYYMRCYENKTALKRVLRKIKRIARKILKI
ncbi:MAG: glycosyltransferase family 2 protein, partial [Synergistaceae bacterium]|nr:glycosyltransferase family 2 protein [Synergistaceae bacterium]